MMELSKGQEVAALFDLDGVVFDTESQYSLFWGMKGKTYHPEVEHFENVIKGQTLVQIFDRWFAGCDDVQRKIAGELRTLNGTWPTTMCPEWKISFATCGGPVSVRLS